MVIVISTVLLQLSTFNTTNTRVFHLLHLIYVFSSTSSASFLFTLVLWVFFFSLCIWKHLRDRKTRRVGEKEKKTHSPLSMFNSFTYVTDDVNVSLTIQHVHHFTCETFYTWHRMIFSILYNVFIFIRTIRSPLYLRRGDLRQANALELKYESKSVTVYVWDRRRDQLNKDKSHERGNWWRERGEKKVSSDCASTWKVNLQWSHLKRKHENSRMDQVHQWLHSLGQNRALNFFFLSIFLSPQFNLACTPAFFTTFSSSCDSFNGTFVHSKYCSKVHWIILMIPIIYLTVYWVTEALVRLLAL